ncbi:MAG: DNA-processing protein DprA [Candidatus Saccharimonadales bacterium]
MQSKQITTVSNSDPIYPSKLKQLADPPAQLYVSGASVDSWIHLPKVGIVGSRKVSSYGRIVTERLARELAGQGVVIISGLALGVDSIAHQAALDVGGVTVAVLPGPVETIYPRSHEGLGRRIETSGGTLVSEYASIQKEAFKLNFIARNRIVAALSDVLIITEAAEKSGSLHTAHFALEIGRDIGAVPGNITSPTSIGCNNLIKTGATPITSSQDVLNMLHLEISPVATRIRGANEQEQAILELLIAGVADGDELQIKSELPIHIYNQTLTMLEITGKIRSLGANQWAVR